MDTNAISRATQLQAEARDLVQRANELKSEALEIAARAWRCLPGSIVQAEKGTVKVARIEFWARYDRPPNIYGYRFKKNGDFYAESQWCGCLVSPPTDPAAR